MFRILLPLLVASSLVGSLSAANIGIWANNGEDKVCQEELRLTVDKTDVRNSIFDGRKIKLMAARGETVAFNLIIETPEFEIRDCNVSISDLKSDDGKIPATRREGDDSLFDFRERYIELFLVRYLQIKGCSTLAYEHYDERLVPKRFRRPHDAGGDATGKWTDRPDHDRHYPDIAVPIELESNFDVASGTSQAVWADVFVPAGMPTGIYEGILTVDAINIEPVIVPIELEVIDFTLPELPTARSMLYVSQEDINRRYVGKKFLDEATADDILNARKVLDRHFQLAHRHRISIIHEHTPIGIMDDRWQDKLDGSLFTPANQYDGVGVGVGNNVYSIGTYGAWPWKDGDKATMWRSTDRWVKYFDEKDFETPTDYFLYLIDESAEFNKIETWASWVLKNPGPRSSPENLGDHECPQRLQTDAFVDPAMQYRCIRNSPILERHASLLPIHRRPQFLSLQRWSSRIGMPRDRRRRRRVSKSGLVPIQVQSCPVVHLAGHLLR